MQIDLDGTNYPEDYFDESDERQDEFELSIQEYFHTMTDDNINELQQLIFEYYAESKQCTEHYGIHTYTPSTEELLENIRNRKREPKSPVIVPIGDRALTTIVPRDAYKYLAGQYNSASKHHAIWHHTDGYIVVGPHFEKEFDIDQFDEATEFLKTALQVQGYFE